MTDALASRPARPEDIDWLLALRLATMSEHFARSGQDLDDAEQLARVKHRFDAVRVLSRDGRDVGMTKILREGALWHLVQIQIVPEAQGQGLGSAVIGELLAEAEGAGAAVSLQVLKVNPAQRLYQRLGFVITDDTGHSYEMRAACGSA